MQFEKQFFPALFTQEDRLNEKTDEEMFMSAETMFHLYYSFLRGKSFNERIVQVDSDEEYRNPDDFLGDQLIIQPEIKGKETLLYYFQFFHGLSSQIKDPVTKQDFLKKINGVIEGTKSEMESLTY